MQSVQLARSVGLQDWKQESSHLIAVPDFLPRWSRDRGPVILRATRVLRTVLASLCGLVILGYGLDVAKSSEVGKLQDQARRLSEQNTELSAELLRAISFQGIQSSVVGHLGLRVPEQVIIVKEVSPVPFKSFKSSKYFLPIMSGY